MKTDVKGKVFTVRYAVWALGPADPDFDTVCADMNTLYRLMIPGGKFGRFVDIHRT